MQPLAATSFMKIRDPSQRREYKEKVDNIRDQRGLKRRGPEKPYINYEKEDKSKFDVYKS